MLQQLSWRRLRLLSPNGPFPKDGRYGLVGQSNTQCYRLRWSRKWNQTPRLYCWHQSSSYRSPVPVALSDHSGLQPPSRPRMAITKVRLWIADEAGWSISPLDRGLCPLGIVRDERARRLPVTWVAAACFPRPGRTMRIYWTPIVPPGLVYRMSRLFEQSLGSVHRPGWWRSPRNAQGPEKRS